MRSNRLTERATLKVLIALLAAACSTATLAQEGPRDLCSLLSKADVSRALGMEIVRAEVPETELAGCDFSTRGSAANLTASHTTQLAKSAASANGSSIDGPTEKLLETFGNALLKGSDSDTPATARHPGEVAVFSFAIMPGDGAGQMRLTRQTHAGIASAAVTTVPNLGDEAFDSGGAMLSVRKGKRMIQFIYASCSCTTREIIPLARKVVNQL